MLADKRLTRERIVDFERHPVVRGWQEVAPGSAARDLELIKRKDDSSVYILRIWGADAVVVAKVWKLMDTPGEITVYREVLTRLPIHSVECFGAVEFPEDEVAILYLENVGRRPYRANMASHSRALGRWLGQLHAGASFLDRARVDLPATSVGSIRELSRKTAEAIRDAVVGSEMDAGKAEGLHGCLEALRHLELRWAWLEDLERELPTTLVHGDLTAKNIKMRRAAAGIVPLVLDWEHAGWGVPAADLGDLTVGGAAASFGRSAYLSEIAAVWGERVTELPLFEAGRILRIVQAMHWESLDLPFSSKERALRRLAIHRHDLNDALRALGVAA